MEFWKDVVWKAESMTYLGLEMNSGDEFCKVSLENLQKPWVYELAHVQITSIERILE